MRTRLLTFLLTLALLMVGFGQPAAEASPAIHEAPVIVRHATLEVPCGRFGRRVSVDWYFPQSPSADANGLIWLQHGFLRTKRNVASLAESVAARTNSIVVTPTISSNFLDPAGCWINGEPMHKAVARLFADRGALQASARRAGRKVALPRPFVLSGHSAGGNLALSAAGFTTLPGGAIGDLQAVVMFDGVDNGGAMTTALNRLTGANFRPVLQIAAPPSLCNALGSGTRALLAARPGRFVGVELENGTHIDAEGPDTDLLAALVCGVPRPVNVHGLRTIAADWITNAFTGSSIGIVGGSPGEQIPVDGATAIVLPARPD